MFFGFGLQKKSPYNEPLSEHILALRQQGYIEELYEKCVVNKSECRGPGVQAAEESGYPRYGVRHMLGVFTVIFVATCVSIVILMIEWIISSYRVIDTSIIYRPNTFCGGLAYRCGRMKRDFMVNYIPDHISTDNHKKNVQPITCLICIKLS